MKRMTMMVLLAGLLPLHGAYAKSPEGPDAWNKASVADRDAMVKQIMMLNRGTYAPEKMRKCLDDAFAPTAARRPDDLPTAAILCHAQLQPRK
jgi:hypothetical protein